MRLALKDAPRKTALLFVCLVSQNLFALLYRNRIKKEITSFFFCEIDATPQIFMVYTRAESQSFALALVQRHFVLALCDENAG